MLFKRDLILLPWIFTLGTVTALVKIEVTFESNLKPFVGVSKFDLHELAGEGAKGYVYKARVPRVYGYGKITSCDDPTKLRQLLNKEVMLMQLGGEDLDKILENKKRNGGFTSEEVEHIALEMMKCIKSVHDKRIMHLDIKPGNFIAASDDEFPVAGKGKGKKSASKLAIGIKLWLVDFGVARRESGKGVVGKPMGTPYYWSLQLHEIMDYLLIPRGYVNSNRPPNSATRQLPHREADLPCFVFCVFELKGLLGWEIETGKLTQLARLTEQEIAKKEPNELNELLRAIHQKK